MLQLYAKKIHCLF